MSESEQAPATQAQGDLDPPDRRPPTAVGAAAPSPPPQRRPTRVNPGAWRRRPAWTRGLDLVLDALDFAADRVADVAGLR